MNRSIDELEVLVGTGTTGTGDVVNALLLYTVNLHFSLLTSHFSKRKKRTLLSSLFSLLLTLPIDTITSI